MPAGTDSEWPRVPGYEILSELGRGGMGVVYKARQVALQRTVALKMLLTGTHAGPKDVARFRAEAAAIARLQHPNIVQIYDVGEAAGRPYFALEFVPGGSLAQHLQGTPQPVRPAAQMVETLARAVHAAHANGVVHRDLKPANILLQKDEAGRMKDESKPDSASVSFFIPHPSSFVPKITDFGLAKRVDGSEEVAGLRGPTVTGELLGTPNYMAPEQAATPRQAVGPAADVYALGAILYEMLTGRPPFAGETPLATVLQVLHTEPVSVTSLAPNVPRDLETICLKCLQKEPRRRYGSALELAEDLHRFLISQPIRARPPSALYRWHKFAQRKKALVVGVLGILVALVGGAVTSGLFALRATEQRDRAEEYGRRADQDRDAALRKAYYARLAAAGAALRDDDVAAAARHLVSRDVPEALRDWEWHHLHTRLDESLGVLRAPDRGEMLLASGSKGVRLLAAGRDLRLLDPDGRQVFSIPRNGLRVLHVEHSRQGTRVLGYDEAGRLVVLDEAGKVRLRLDPPPGRRADVVAVSPDQTRLAVYWGQNDPHCFELYDLSSGQKRAVFVGHADYIHALAFSPDSRQIASASEDATARLWDAATGAPFQVLRGHADKVFRVAYAPSGTRVVTASADGTVRQWTVATGKLIAVPYRGHRHEVQAVVYSADGRRIASGDHNGTVRLWRADDQLDLAVLHGHTQSVVQLEFNQDGQQLASTATDGTARIWEVGPRLSPALLRGHKSYVYPLAYSPDGQWIASGSWDGTVRLWDARTGALGTILRHTNRVRALAFSPDNSWLVCACDEQDRLQIWDVATGQRHKQIAAPGKVVQAVTVSPDGGRVAAADRSGRVGITDFATGQEVATFRMAGEWAEKKALAYSPDGRRLAGTGEDGKNIDIWDAHTYERAARLVGHTAAVYSVAFSQDGRRLVSAGGDRTVRIWDTATGDQLAVLEGHTDEVFTAVFHPDVRRVASAGRDRVILLWDVASGTEVARLQGHRNYVFSLVFSPDGTTLASGSGDFTVRLWDTMPLAGRLKARREAETLRPEADRLVERLFRERKAPSDVIRAVRSDDALSDPLRREAQRAIWRRLTAME